MAEANDPVITKSMLNEALRESSKSTIDDIASIIRDFSTRVDERFNNVEARLTNLEMGLVKTEERLTSVERGIAELNTKYDKLVQTLDAFLKRLDDKETEDAARDAHLERLDRWVHQVADRLQLELR